MIRREITEQTEINGTNGKGLDQITSVCSVYFRLFRNLSSSLLLICSLTIAACAQDVPITPREPQKKKAQETAKVEQAPKPRLPADKNKFAIIISGIGGEAGYTKQFAEWTAKLHSALVER